MIIGGGQGGIALGARLPATRCADDHRGEERAPGDSWRKALQVPLPARPRLYDHLPYIDFPEKLARVLKDKIGDGWRCTRM